MLLSCNEGQETLKHKLKQNNVGHLSNLICDSICPFEIKIVGGAREVAQSVKCLPGKHKDSLISSTNKVKR